MHIGFRLECRRAVMSAQVSTGPRNGTERVNSRFCRMSKGCRYFGCCCSTGGWGMETEMWTLKWWIA